MGIQPEGERKNDTGESVFPETDPIFLFSGLLIYFLLYIGMNTESCGVSRPDPCQNQVLHIKLYKGLRGLHHLLAMRPADILWPFLIMVSQPENLFFPGVIFS